MRLLICLFLIILPLFQQNRDKILAEFIEFLPIPNVAADRANILRNARWLESALKKRGVEARLLEIIGAPPVVFGRLDAPGATQTAVFYAHYDGQPADPGEWTGSAPWKPSLRGGRTNDPEARLYARSAADDKAPIIAMLAALDSMKSRGISPKINLKFVFEGEEEAGSPNLSRILSRYKDLLAAGFWLICDGPVHQSRRMQLYFGARGVVGLNLTVYGAARELHSGHYGNWAPNPAMLLAELLASMRAPDGRVAIAGFYDGIEPLTQLERDALAAAPPIDDELRRSLLFARPGHPSLLESVNEPALNIRGLAAAGVGAASRNVVPAEARASIDIRLVKGNHPRVMVEKLRAHIERQGYFVAHAPPTPEQRLAHPRLAMLNVSDFGYRAVRTPMDHPASRQVIEAVRRLHPGLVLLPTLGGSVPLSLIEDIFPVPLIGVPIVNHDNNQHAANENLRLKNLWDAIPLFESLFTLPPPDAP